MRNFWKNLNPYDKFKIILFFCLIFVGTFATIFFLAFQNNLNNYLNDSNKDIDNSVHTDADIDTETQDFYANMGIENPDENQYTEEVLELYTKLDNDGVKGFKQGPDIAEIDTVTILNGSFVSNIDDITDETLNSYLEEQGISAKKYKNYSKRDKLYLYLGYNAQRYFETAYVIYSKDKKEYTFKESEFNNLLSLYQNQNYEEVIDKIKDITDKYSLSKGKNRFIASLYSDALLMKDFDKINSDEDKKTILENHKNPIALAIDTLYVLPQMRNDIIVKKDSLSPYLEDYVRVVDYVRVNNGTEEFKYHSADYDSTVNLYKITLEVLEDGNEIVCYVRQDSEGILTIDGYYDKDEPTGYRTVQFWEEQNN